MAAAVGCVVDRRRRRRAWRPPLRAATVAAAVAAVIAMAIASTVVSPVAAMQSMRLFLLYPTGLDAPNIQPGVDAETPTNAAPSLPADGAAVTVSAADEDSGNVSSVGDIGNAGSDGRVGSSVGGDGDNGTSLAGTASSGQIAPVAPGTHALSRMLLNATLLGLADAVAPGGVLPDSVLTIQAIPIDTQANLLVGTHILCRMLSSMPPADAYALVGPLESDVLWLSTVAAYQWNLPIVSSTATALALNAVDESELWPVNASSSSGKPTSYLFHTVPRDDFRVKAVLDLVIRMKRKRDAARARRPWSVYKEERIGVLFSEDQFGQSGMYALFRRLASAIATSPTGDLQGSTIPLRIVRKLPMPVSGDAGLQLRDLLAADVRIIVPQPASPPHLLPPATHARALPRRIGRAGAAST